MVGCICSVVSGWCRLFRCRSRHRHRPLEGLDCALRCGYVGDSSGHSCGRRVQPRRLLITDYNYFRDYDPQTGRYVESDPHGLHGGSLSTYAYAANDPLFFVDPFGLDLTVTLYQGPADHVGIGVNSPITNGYYPAENKDLTPLNISVPGVEKPDTGETPIDSITIHTDPQQDAAVLAFIKNRMKNPGKYNLYSRNCANAVESALSSAHISAPNDTLPKNLFDWLKQQYGPHVAGASR